MLYFVKHLQKRSFLLSFKYMKATQIKSIECPIAKVATLLSDAWTILIIRDLLSKPKRFSELQASLHGISSRTLTLKLKRLESLQIITHEEAIYQTTPQGKKFSTIIKSMEQYGKHL